MSLCSVSCTALVVSTLVLSSRCSCRSVCKPSSAADSIPRSARPPDRPANLSMSLPASIPRGDRLSLTSGSFHSGGASVGQVVWSIKRDLSRYKCLMNLVSKELFHKSCFNKLQLSIRTIAIVYTDQYPCGLWLNKFMSYVNGAMWVWVVLKYELGIKLGRNKQSG